jgi:hypothetical protein
MSIVEANRQYQALLEAHRIDPDDEMVWQELQMAKAALERLWLEHAVTVG